jgi:soluble lytic murein transglycosylase-like protein
MTYSTIILAAAKAAKVSGALLLAICTQESNLTNAYVLHDGGSPSIGVCQLKYETAKMVGFKGKPNQLMDVGTNAKFAAKYLAFQQERYGDDWHKLAAAYNAGSYIPSNKVIGCPRNLLYVKAVKDKLDDEFHVRMVCGK